MTPIHSLADPHRTPSHVAKGSSCPASERRFSRMSSFGAPTGRVGGPYITTEEPSGSLELGGPRYVFDQRVTRHTAGGLPQECTR
jgi:hypothetical protein